MSDLRTRFESLTPREREVMVLVTAGLMNKQNKAHLGVPGVPDVGVMRPHDGF